MFWVEYSMSANPANSPACKFLTCSDLLRPAQVQWISLFCPINLLIAFYGVA